MGFLFGLFFLLVLLPILSWPIVVFLNYALTFILLFLAYFHVPGIFLYIFCSITYIFLKITKKYEYPSIMRNIATFSSICIFIHIIISFFFIDLTYLRLTEPDAFEWLGWDLF